jgi:hypothetical protein
MDVSVDVKTFKTASFPPRHIDGLDLRVRRPPVELIQERLELVSWPLGDDLDPAVAEVLGITGKPRVSSQAACEVAKIDTLYLTADKGGKARLSCGFRGGSVMIRGII